MECPACGGYGYTNEMETPTGGTIKLCCMKCLSTGQIAEEEQHSGKSGTERTDAE